MNESLILVGMNVRPLAQSAVKTDFEVAGIGVLGYRDLPSNVRYLSLAHNLGGLFPIGDPHARIALAAQAQQARSLAYSGGFENFPELVDKMSEACELLGNSAATLRGVRDPFRLRDVVDSIGMETPQILPPGTQPDPSLRWLRKQVKSGAGYQIEPWDSVVPDDPEFLVQRWIEGISASASFIANGQEARVFSVTHQLSGDSAFGAPGFQYTGNILLPNPDPDLLKRLNLLATTLTQELGLVGLNGVDFILDGDDQLSILEVNPRYSASMELVEEALDAPLFEWHIAGCRGQALPIIPERHDQKVYGKAIVYAQRDGILPDTSEWPAKGRRDVADAGIPIPAGFPICTVTAVGDDQQECYANLLAEADELLNLS